MAELLILGTGTGLPNVKRAAPGYLLNIDNKNILIESGSGTLQRLIKYEITYQDIDYLLYSHLHPDHTLDFASILFAARNPKNPRKRELVVIGPKGLEDFYEKLLSLYGTSIRPESYRLIFKKMDDSALELDFCKILTKTVKHTDESIGIRVELKNGRSLAYSGDTDYCENMVSLSSGADILILECSAPDEFKMDGHLSPSLAGRIASEANCKKLVLTHFYPICDRYPILKELKDHFKGKVILAKDGMRLRL